MIYTGSTKDGSDIRPAQGVYVSPDGNEWSNKPYTKEQIEDDKWFRRRERIFDHINGKRTLRDEYHLILQKKSTLPKACRNMLVEWIENQE